MSGTKIVVHPIHLGLGATAVTEPEFTGSMDWYAGYVDRHQSDGAEGRLVSMHTFQESWKIWEMHPQGCEVVLCIAGTMTLHQERGRLETIAAVGSRRLCDQRAGHVALGRCRR